MRWLRKCFLPLLAWMASCSATPALAQVKFTEAHRAKSTNPGASWWACAQTVANRDSIAPMQQLLERAGHIPATEATILQAAKDFKFAYQGSPHGNTQEGLNWITRNLEASRPVIVGINSPHVSATHILVVAVSRDRQDFDNNRGLHLNDYVVDYIDPSNGGNYRFAMSSFQKAWTGQAHTLDQTPPEVAGPPAQLAIPVGPPIGPPPVVPQKLTSNQDINDGIRRPADTLEYGLYGMTRGQYDYHSEYRSRRQ